MRTHSRRLEKVAFAKVTLGSGLASKPNRIAKSKKKHIPRLVLDASLFHRVATPHSCRCSLTALIRRCTGRPDARVRNNQLESLSDVRNLASGCYWIANNRRVSVQLLYPVRPGLACLSGVSTEARAITRVLFPFIINLHRGQISGHDQYLHALISVQSTEYYCYNILGCYPQAGGSSRVHDKTFHAKAKQG